jgi:hypothetical protein
MKHSRDRVMFPRPDLRADPGDPGSLDFDALPWNPPKKPPKPFRVESKTRLPSRESHSLHAFPLPSLPHASGSP